MKLDVLKGTTSKLIEAFIQNNSVSTGAGLTGLVFNSGSLTAYYYRSGAASAVAISLVTMTAGTWTSGGFVAVDGTNMPGLYQLGIPDAALASGANSVVIMLKGATNMAPVVVEIQLTSYDPNDATRLGLTALPNANAAANGGLPTIDANNAVKVQSGTGANQISLTSGLVTLAGVTHTGAVIPTVSSVASGGITSSSFAAGAINAAAIAPDAIGASELAADAVTEIQTGLATSTALGTAQTSLDAIKTKTDSLPTDPADASDIAALISAISTLVSALPSAATIASTVWAAASRTLTAFGFSVTVGTNGDKTGYSLSSAGIDAILDDPITEPAAVFSWGSATLRNIVGWIGALSRNKMTQTSAIQTLRNDADDAAIATAATSDNGTTTTRAEWQ